MSHRALGNQFIGYHASSRMFKEGDVLRPGAHLGTNNFDTKSLEHVSDDHVFMSDNLRDAHHWAEAIGYGAWQSGQPAMHIYEVEASGVRSQRHEDGPVEYLAKKAFVRRPVKTMPFNDKAAWELPK